MTGLRPLQKGSAKKALRFLKPALVVRAVFVAASFERVVQLFEQFAMVLAQSTTLVAALCGFRGGRVQAELGSFFAYKADMCGLLRHVSSTGRVRVLPLALGLCKTDRVSPTLQALWFATKYETPRGTIDAASNFHRYPLFT